MVFAEATLVAGAVLSAGAIADRAGAAEGLVSAEIVPSVTTYRRGLVEGLPTAELDVSRPWDLGHATLDAGAELDATGTRIAGGFATLEGTATADEIESIRYAFFATLDAGAEFEAAGVRERVGAAEFIGTATWDADVYRWRRSRVDGTAAAEMDASAVRFRGGLHVIDAGAELNAYAIVNGVHEGTVLFDAGASLENEPVRMAGGFVDAVASGEMDVTTYPWLGSAVEGVATAELDATWWTYVQASADGGGTAEVLAEATNTQHAAAQADAGALLDADWNMIVFPEVTFLLSTAESSAQALRVKHEAVMLSAHGEASAEALRIGFPEAEMVGTATGEIRAFVNFTNDAPDWRSMTVRAERRKMVVPFENRTMVVR